MSQFCYYLHMSSIVFDRFLTDLKERGFSITDERKLIFKELENKSPLSVSTLLENIKYVDRSTIYRTLDLFEKLGFINKVYIGWKYKVELSEKYSPHHHHITCSNCNEIIPIQSEELVEQAIIHLCKINGVHHISHQLEIRGVCEKCTQKHGTQAVMLGS